MSTSDTLNRIEYPESDGKPMGETDLHHYWMVQIESIMRYRYRGERVYVTSDLLVYYLEGNPKKVVVPDAFVVLDCEPSMRRVFKTWEEEHTPDVVFEVTSLSTRRKDLVDKPKTYAQIGVNEYFLFDPTGDYLDEGLQGFRLEDGAFRAIPMREGKLACRTLGIDLCLVGHDLHMVDMRTGERLLCESGAEREAKELEREAKEVERELKEEECKAKERAQQAEEEARRDRDQERRGREAAEAKVRELQEEIERLRGQ